MDTETTVDATLESTAKPTPPSQLEIDTIIRKRVYAAMAVGVVPIPLFDLGALTAIHIELLHRLCQAYDIPFKAEWGKKVVGCLLASTLPLALTPNIANVLRLIPVIGQGMSFASLSLTNAAATYTVGQVFAKHFASGGTMLTCDMEKIGADIKAGFAKSKETVKSWTTKKSAAADTTAGVDIDAAETAEAGSAV